MKANQLGEGSYPNNATMVISLIHKERIHFLFSYLKFVDCGKFVLIILLASD